MAQANEAAVRAWNKAKEGKTPKKKGIVFTDTKTRKKVVYFKGSNGMMWMEVEIEDGTPMMESTFLFNAPPKARSYRKAFEAKTILRKKAA